jgi:hypothetical protein
MLSKRVYDLFVKWFKSNYNTWFRGVPKNDRNLVNTKEFQNFIAETGVQPEFIAEPEPELTEMSEEEQLEYWEEKYTDPSNPPHGAPEGKEWYWQDADPTTGMPLSEPRWALRDVATTVEGESWKIGTQGGYDVLLIRDENGNWIPSEVLGKTGTEETITREQELKQQWALKEAELATQRQWARAEEAKSMIQSRWAELAEERDYRKGVPTQEQMAQIWEDVKGQILQSFGTAPENAIQVAMVKTTQNPYVQAPVNQIPEQKAMVQGQLKYLKTELKQMKDQSNDPEDPFYLNNEAKQYMNFLQNEIRNQEMVLAGMESGAYGGTGMTPGMWKTVQGAFGGGGGELRAADTARRWVANPGSPEFANLTTEQIQALQNIGTGLGIYGQGAYMPQEYAVTTPKWLQPLVTGLGETIPRTGAPKVNPISGQAWQRLTPSQQGTWASLVKHAGQNPEDVLATSRSMLPKGLSLGKRWKSFSQ